MVACYSGSQQVAWEAESSWAEDVDTMTYAVPLAAPVDVSGITQQMLDASRVTSRRLAYSKGVLGPWSISFTLTSNLTGHGSTAAGAISATALARYLELVLGGRDTTLAAGTTATGGTTTVPTLTAASGFPAGGIVRFGSLGDGDGEGQFYAFSTHASNNLNLYHALAGAPAAAQVVYSPELVYPANSACSMTGTRFRILTADLQFVVHGCFPTSISFSGLEPGGHPQVSVTWSGSWAEPISGTFPTTPNADEFNWQPPSAGGSLFLQDLATTTRAVYGYRAFSVDYQLGISPVTGGNGVNQYQTITGATRTKDTIMVNVTLDGQGADATPQWWDSWGNNTSQHMMYTAHSADGTAFGLYFRNLCWMGNRPSQSSTNDRNTIPLSFRADNHSTTTSDLTLAPMVLALA